MDFNKVKAGEWVHPTPKGYLMKCCDCGLVHRIDFRVVKLGKNGKTATVQSSRYRAELRAFRED